MNSLALSEQEKELLHHKKKLANASLCFGMISILSGACIVAAFVFYDFGRWIKNCFSLMALITFIAGFLGVLLGCYSKAVNRKLRKDEAIQEQYKSRAELGILLGLLNLLPMSIITFFALWLFNSSISMMV